MLGTLVLKDINFELEEEVLYLAQSIWIRKSAILISLPVFWMRRLEISTLMGNGSASVPTNKQDIHTRLSVPAPCFHMTVFENVAFPLRLKKVRQRLRSDVGFQKS